MAICFINPIGCTVGTVGAVALSAIGKCRTVAGGKAIGLFVF
ncbi:hypothetical protein QUB19_02185 [Microcoleus sp. B4-C5]